MISARSTAATSHRNEMMREIADFIREFVVAAFSPYRPELHYMRGPGPACHARTGALDGLPPRM